MKLFLIAVFCVVLALGDRCAAQSFRNCSSCTCPGIDNYWHASLLPSEVVPKVNNFSSALGSFIVNLEFSNSTHRNFSDNLVLSYHLFAKGNSLTDVTLHVGSRCSTGPVVADLTKNASRNATSSVGGIFDEGILTNADLTGPLSGYTVFDLIQEINEGNVYITVASVNNPFGEIRGQVQLLQPATIVASDLLNATACNGKFNQMMNHISANSSNSTCQDWNLNCICRVNSYINRTCLYNCSSFNFNSTCGATCTRATNNTLCRNFNTSCSNSTNPFPFCNCTQTCTNNVLSGDGPFTVFALSDAATKNHMSFEPHIVKGAYTFSDFLGKITLLRTLSGIELVVDGTQPSRASGFLKAAHHARVTVNGVPITHANEVVARNGIVHGLADAIHIGAHEAVTPAQRGFSKFGLRTRKRN